MQKLLRKEMLVKRLSLNANAVDGLSKIIEDKARSILDLEKYSEFFVYLDFKNEVKTDYIINYLIKKGKSVSFPKIIGDNMIAVKPTNEAFESDLYGISVPKEYEEVKSVEVAIIPLIACDENKNRIGFGKGYYDKFLKDKNILKIGLCYDFQIVERIESNSWDIPLDFIVSERRIIK